MDRPLTFYAEMLIALGSVSGFCWVVCTFAERVG